MAGLPSHIFVVRHGNRLDAADNKWHLSSPTPYDPPLTYGGFQQGRQVGNQIASILEQIKLEAESSSNNTIHRRKRFRIVIHSSPFLRCVQTSVGISSGLSQIAHDSPFSVSDLICTRDPLPGKPDNQYRSAILRLDAFLGEWMSPEYFENITPPPGSSLMIGSAKAELLRREDYSMHIETEYTTPPLHQAQAQRKSSLWNGSPTQSNSPASDGGSAYASPRVSNGLPIHGGEREGYKPLRATYAVSNAGPIPQGFVAHSRDECVAVDYQWDSSRGPLDFGDGGDLPEEWTAMHRRFRGGLKKLLHWYAHADSPAELVSTSKHQSHSEDHSTSSTDEDIETVVVIVSHGAGCNALIGAITHQPVLMDVGIASITMASRKTELDYVELLANTEGRDSRGNPIVHVDHMYDIRISASTEHLRSTASTPAVSRSGSTAGVKNGQHRGRTSTLGSAPGPALANITFLDSFGVSGNRSSSASASFGSIKRRDSGSQRPGNRPSALASTGLFSGPGSGGSTGRQSPPTAGGLWRPTAAPSSLRLMDDGSNDADKDDDFPNFDQARLSPKTTSPPRGIAAAFESIEEEGAGGVSLKATANGPMLAGPIKIQTNWGEGLKDEHKPEEVFISPFGDESDGVWGRPHPPGEAERLRDLSFTKRRWTMAEKST